MVGQSFRNLFGFNIGAVVFSPQLELQMFYGNPGFYAGLLVGWLVEENGWNLLLSLLPAGMFFLAITSVLCALFPLAMVAKGFPYEINSIFSMCLPYSLLGHIFGVQAKRLKKKGLPRSRRFLLSPASWLIVGGTALALIAAYEITEQALSTKYDDSQWRPTSARALDIDLSGGVEGLRGNSEGPGAHLRLDRATHRQAQVGAGRGRGAGEKSIRADRAVPPRSGG